MLEIKSYKVFENSYYEELEKSISKLSTYIKLAGVVEKLFRDKIEKYKYLRCININIRLERNDFLGLAYISKDSNPKDVIETNRIRLSDLDEPIFQVNIEIDLLTPNKPKFNIIDNDYDKSIKEFERQVSIDSMLGYDDYDKFADELENSPLVKNNIIIGLDQKSILARTKKVSIEIDISKYIKQTHRALKKINNPKLY